MPNPPEELQVTWLRILEKVQESLSKSACEKWLAPVRPLRLDGGELELLQLVSAGKAYVQDVGLSERGSVHSLTFFVELHAVAIQKIDVQSRAAGLYYEAYLYGVASGDAQCVPEGLCLAGCLDCHYTDMSSHLQSSSVSGISCLIAIKEMVAIVIEIGYCY